MLKYLFVCQYNDGTEFKQTEEDVSRRDPKRSSFFDIAQEKLARFSLVGDGQVFSVVLSNGRFEVNNTPLWLHDPETTLCNRRLIFFRQHTHTVGADLKEKSHTVRYFFGWQANLEDGTKIERVMGVD